MQRIGSGRTGRDHEVRPPRRRARRLAIGATAIAGLAGALASPAGATLSVQATRLAGANRYATAMAVAEATFDNAPVALLANGRSYADALSANYASGGLGAPLLLTEVDALPAGTIESLRDLGTQNVIIIGGVGAVSAGVAQSLVAEGFVVNRISGGDRYETARLIGRTFASSAVGEVDGKRTAILATGEGFADALAAAPLSAARGLPIVLTPAAAMHPDSQGALEDHEIRQVVVVGGPAAVSQAVVAEIEALGIEVRRIAGANRQETAAAIGQFAADSLGFAMDRALIARGDQFADALAAGTRGGRLRAPVVLVRSRDDLGDVAREFLREHVDTLVSVDVMGGTAVITQAVVDDALQAARGA